MNTDVHTPRTAPGHLEAFQASGSSPTPETGDGRPSQLLDGASARSALTVHLVGPGAVGCALLERLPTEARLIAASDRSGTLCDPAGLDTGEVVDRKRAGRRLLDGSLLHDPGRDTPRSTYTSLTDAVAEIGADVLIDTSSTDFERTAWGDVLERDVLARGRLVILAAKDALAARGHRWLERYGDRLGVNAVLGGTGRLLSEELDELRRRWRSVALAGNASTTVILSVVEAGDSLDAGIEEADRLGLLETDPELDLRGADAAVKVAIVAGALLGSPVDPSNLSSTDIRCLDPEEVRAAARRGKTTRLVGRISRTGDCSLSYEEVELGSPLAVPRDRAAYVYELESGDRRVHLGRGLGAVATAEAALHDLARLTEVAR